MVAARGIDALVVLPFEIRAAHRARGLKVSQGPRASGSRWSIAGSAQEGIEDLYVAGDNPGFGRVSGEYFTRERSPMAATSSSLRGIPTTIDNERVEGFQSAIEGSGIEILGMEHGNWNRDDSFTVMQDFLSKIPADRRGLGLGRRHGRGRARRHRGSRGATTSGSCSAAPA